jgi:pimeloyl-ACP methyl ester carboxylesterase
MRYASANSPYKLVMLNILTKSNKPNVILFVHGFCGGVDTWKHDNGSYFHQHIIKSPIVSEHFDIATFDYFSKFFNTPVAAGNMLSKIKSLFKTSSNKNEKNIGIDEISELLKTNIRFHLDDYENVVIIAHSMGGLITKNYIANEISESGNSKVKLFISLAVPHLGAELATYGKLFSNHEQINDLAPLSEICPKLNQQWVKLSIKPNTKYFYGTYDDTVKKASAISIDCDDKDIVACDDSHGSICKPESEFSTVVIATNKFLKEFIEGSGEITLAVQKLENSDQFSDEHFVLKLILADVHHATITHSKEHFLNAEYARKLFSSASDQNKLSDLYTKIRTLYHDSYDKFLHTEEMTPGKLVSELHEKIVSEDSSYLKSALPLIHGLHKKGMLHQLANDLSDDIWWTEECSIAALDKVKLSLAQRP